jgi:hypothetical protein
LRPMKSLPSHDSGISCGTPDYAAYLDGIAALTDVVRQLKKVKKANGEIIGVNVVSTYPALSHAALKRQADGNADRTTSRFASCALSRARSAAIFFSCRSTKRSL